jgi:bifunctional DNase/RNase
MPRAGLRRHALHDMARDHAELTGQRLFSVFVRDERDATIYRATLMFDGRST